MLLLLLLLQLILPNIVVPSLWSTATTEEDDDGKCVQWRETLKCDAHGMRNPGKDSACSVKIESPRSGYCDCGNNKRAREVTCDHHPFTCSDVCVKEANVDLDIPEDYEHVTYGSTIKLVHDDSRFRLHSHEVQYGSGSQQQSVTAHGSNNDPSSYWMIKESHEADQAIAIGTAIRCNDHIRLEHISTRRNLHSHKYKSPISKQYEVSAFGVTGEGDEFDSWRLVCLEENQCDAETKKCVTDEQQVWKRHELVRLQHIATGTYLSTSAKHRFDNSNCPRCPINGQNEVAALKIKSTPPSSTVWFAGEGLFVSTM